MKKNYSEPAIKVQTIALQSMMQVTSKESGQGTEGGGQDIHDRSDLLDGLFD